MGVDGISSKLLKTVASGVNRSLTSLFNASLTSGKVPSEWKSARVTPVHKGGDSELTGNYRPVSVLPVVVKVFERLVHRQLYNYLQENELLNPVQFGLRLIFNTAQLRFYHCTNLQCYPLILGPDH